MRAIATGSPGGLIEAARASDLNQVRWLLNVQALPNKHIGTDALRGFLVCRDEVGIMGAVGLELLTRHAVLHSLVVDEALARRGLGRRLVEAAERLAIEAKIVSIYLHTLQEPYFQTLGYRYLKLERVPEEIARHPVFAHDLATHSITMVKKL